ncbi:MAG: beta-ketoacyl synthase N-terminal-like domain-containing protein [Xenococcaceae cyanobacterium MO_167.B27]|nr:beta-ketoacyl synthase N-terminal-like domain-containing protein [Xenococcaceae cyanobacterium MO_167.B27]
MESIAIVGIDCRFPGARNKEEFWELLCCGKDAIATIPDNRWDIESFYSSEASIPGSINTRNGGFITEADAFDAEFFGIPPRQAEAMDPQQRLLLQTAWRAIEDAGISPVQLEGSNTGVFVGIMGNEWAYLHMTDYQNITAQIGSGNGYCMSPNRISYHFNFKGPSLAIDTACSSSLVAVHNACNSLASYECDYALAGGVNLILTPALNIFYTQAGLSSPEGRCKSFSSKADGIGRGEGVGVVLLRRLEDAIADKQRIYGVIKGSAVNQNGRSNGITAPNRWAQQEVMEQAYRRGKVTPEQITFIEAHGTGTKLGDLIEIKALKQVHSVSRPRPCYLGSVKSNIGHLEGAAGIAGLIKVTLALYHKRLPASLHCQEENQHLDLNPRFLKLQKETTDLPETETIFAGLSSFGLGGTNAHIVLQSSESKKLHQETTTPACSSSTTNSHSGLSPVGLGIFTLSAKNAEALRENIKEQLNYLTRHPELDIASVCASSNRAKAGLSARVAFSSFSIEHLRQQLQECLETDISTIAQVKLNVKPKIAFLFTGQGSQYTGMTRSLYRNNSVFREYLLDCDRAFQPYLGLSIKDIIFQPENQEALNQTQFAQPAIFTIQYALTKLWQTLGITPQVAIGHSVGEYAAATLAGILSLNDAAYLVTERGRLMQALPSEGAMLAVRAEEDQFSAWLEQYPNRLAVAAYNGNSNLVLSGCSELIKEIQKFCKQQKIKAKLLKVSHAFHSPLMDSILEKFHKTAETVTYYSPQMSIISSLTGTVVGNKTKMDADYWTNHISEPVKYLQACQNLQKFKLTHVIEIGAKPILINLAEQILPSATNKWLPSVKNSGQDMETLYDSLVELYLDGAKLNWQTLYDTDSLESIPLPVYKFQTKQRFWFEVKSSPSESSFLSNTLITEPESLSTTNTPKKSPNSCSDLVLNLTASIAGYQDSQISLQDKFSEELGYDSIMLIELKNKLEKALPKLGKLPVTELLANITSVGDLVSYLQNKLQATVSV